MKTKILSVLLACLMVLTLVSCGEPEAPPAVQEFADFANEELALGAPDGIEFKAEAHGTEIVYKYKFVELDSTIDADKKEIDVFVESRRRKVAADFEDVVELCPEVTKVVHSFFDKNDVFICSLSSDDTDDTSYNNAELEEFVVYLNESTEDTDDMSYENVVRGDSIVCMIKSKQAYGLTEEEQTKVIEENIDFMKENLDKTYYIFLNSLPTLKSLIYEYYNANNELVHTLESTSADEGDLAVLEYVASQKEFVEKEASNDKYTCNLFALGKSMLYKYTYNNLSNVTDEQRNTLLSTLKSSREALEDVIASIRSECPVLESIIYEYYSTDGDPIASVEIK